MGIHKFDPKAPVSRHERVGTPAGCTTSGRPFPGPTARTDVPAQRRLPMLDGHTCATCGGKDVIFIVSGAGT
jgi:hypothetical protein